MEQCILGIGVPLAGVSRDIWGDGGPQRLQYPECPGGTAEYQITTQGGGGEEGSGPAPSSLWDWSNWDNSTSFVCLLQDLKEKKLLEEKENGKDSATNGKVVCPSFPVAASGADGSSGV